MSRSEAMTRSSPTSGGVEQHLVQSARRFDIDALRVAVVGTEEGSFARAATELGRSQSAVSMQIKRLEEEVGKPLFERIGKTVKLTISRLPSAVIHEASSAHGLR